MFRVKSGDYHAVDELDPGNVPLISCGFIENGFVGYYDIPPEKSYCKAITVAYNGTFPLTTKYHPYRFGAKDDVAVLLPLYPMQERTLLYMAAHLNTLTWRYSYGRKCYREKLQKVSVSLPVLRTNGDVQVDERAIADLLIKNFNDYLPKKTNKNAIIVPGLQWDNFNILTLFDLERGDFHSIADLDQGSYMTVSRVTSDNGVVGYFDRPDKAKIYERGIITVSTVGGDAYVQLDSFIATDNVIVCKPKKYYRPTTLYFIAFMLNQQKWRYSYGRQCYKEKLSKVNLDLPSVNKGELNEDVMQKIVEQGSYWPLLIARFKNHRVKF